MTNGKAREIRSFDIAQHGAKAEVTYGYTARPSTPIHQTWVREHGGRWRNDDC